MVPRLARQPLSGVIAEALKHTLFACLASASITVGLYLLIARSTRRHAVLAALRTSSTAVWFAPATLLLAELSPLALGAALVLVISTTRLLYSQWRLIHPDHSTAFIALPSELFEPPPSPFRLRDLAPALITSFGLQAGVLALLLGDALPAAVLFCLSTAMLTLSALAAGAYEAHSTTSLPRSILGLALTVILAAAFTVGGLAGRIQHRVPYAARSPWASEHRPGPVQSVRALLEKLLQGDESAQPKGSVTTLYAPPAANVEIDDKSFPGVVLWSEPKPRTKLVEPLPTSLRTAIQSKPNEPSSIPFTGEYWMFRPPETRPPPRTSYSRRGNPLTLSFLTTDHAAMAMDAHQRLSHAIDLSCCREIQIVLSNGDRYPATVALELILINGELSQSLGTVEVPSRPQVVLGFIVPSSSSLREFNELKIVFHRDSVRNDRSARMSIERFVLVPRT